MQFNPIRNRNTRAAPFAWLDNAEDSSAPQCESSNVFIDAAGEFNCEPGAIDQALSELYCK